MKLKRTQSKYANHNYNKIFNTRFEIENKWLIAAAIQRVDNICYFLSRNIINPSSILDLGSGPGAIINELKNRNIGKEYTAIDFSAEAINYIRKNFDDVETHVADLTVDNTEIKGDFDLIIAIHVIQHLSNPDLFLKNILKSFNFSYVIIEVPLEDLVINKIVSFFGLNDQNPTGTLQFFNKKSLRSLIERNGLTIIDDKNSIPKINLDTLRILKERYNWNGLQFYKKFITSFILPKIIGPIKKSFHYSYYSLLCVRTNN